MSYYEKNRERVKARVKQYRHNNKEKIRSYLSSNRERISKRDKIWRETNKEHRQAYQRNYYEVNREELLENHRIWIRENAGKKNAHTAKRRAAQKQATPKWLTQKQLAEIQQFYIEATKMNMVVNHIIPLTNPLICGLHVPWNLQLLTESENSSKNNRVDFYSHT